MFVTLMYHLVSEGPRDPMVVAPAAFRAQLRTMEKLGVHLLDLGEATGILDGDPAPQRAVLLTFDDGYRNALERVLPMLGEQGAPAVLSLCSSYLHPETRPQSTVHVSNEFATARDVERWLLAGHDIAGHTVSHPKLTEMSEAAIEDEVARDQRSLQETFGRGIDSFVYPFGSFDPKVEAIVSRFYRNAFADGDGYWPSPERRLAIRRTRVRPEWSPGAFRRRLESELSECLRSTTTPIPAATSRPN